VARDHSRPSSQLNSVCTRHPINGKGRAASTQWPILPAPRVDAILGSTSVTLRNAQGAHTCPNHNVAQEQRDAHIFMDLYGNGDGHPSQSQNPRHIYIPSGEYGARDLIQTRGLLHFTNLRLANLKEGWRVLMRRPWV
jgi:hypothetical protein